MTTVADVLKIICELPPALRDQEKIRSFVMSLPRQQSAEATASQINEARALVDAARP